MALHRKLVEDLRPLILSPIYASPGEAARAPRHTIPDLEMSPDTAYQFVRDELMLDGNARLNLATFVTTWMEPQAERLMAETFDKNMIDKDEYPATAAIEQRCVCMVADFFHAEGRLIELRQFFGIFCQKRNVCDACDDLSPSIFSDLLRN